MVPDVAVIVNCGAPAGVPLFPPAHPARTAPMTSNSAKGTTAAYRLRCGILRINCMAASPASIAASHKTGKSRVSGGTGIFTGAEGGTAPLAVVMIVSVVVWAPVLGVTLVGLNVTVVCAGKPATVKETANEVYSPQRIAASRDHPFHPRWYLGIRMGVAHG